MSHRPGQPLYSNQSKGFAFVELADAESAARCLEMCDGRDFQGRLLHILRARPPPPSRRQPQEDVATETTSSYKEQREQQRRQTAAPTAVGWSASLVRGDAVVDNLAVRLGLRQGDVLAVKDGLSAGDAAVRLALGETAVIQENRAYLAEHGIDMEALVSWSNNKDGTTKSVVDQQPRSQTTLLVKNLPFSTTREELQKMFHRGDPTILLPPSRTIAVVEYRNANDAKLAFRRLAYRRFKSVPLYLEWAPLAASKRKRDDE